MTEEGTFLNVENLLKDTTAALLGGNANMVPDEALVALKALIDMARAIAIEKTKVESGSYVGNNNATKTLTFSAQPKLVLMVSYQINQNSEQSSAWIIPYGATKAGSLTISVSRMNCAWGTNTLTMTEDNQGAYNANGFTYRYVAFI